jgi:hypothetical protein
VTVWAWSPADVTAARSGRCPNGFTTSDTAIPVNQVMTTRESTFEMSLPAGSYAVTTLDGDCPYLGSSMATIADGKAQEYEFVF